MRYVICFILLLNLSACSNQFDYQDNDWYKVTESNDKNPKTVYVDKNRINCQDGKCRAWIKMVLNRQEAINFAGNKKGEVSGYMMVKRVDSSVDYDCKRNTAMINSYQLYDREDKMIDTKWIKSDMEYAKPGTIHGDVLKHVCR